MEFEWAYFFSLLSFYLSMLVPVFFLFFLSLFFLSFVREKERREEARHTRMIGRVVKVTLIAPTVIVIFVIGIDYSFRFCFILSHNIFVCLFVLVLFIDRFV